MTVKEAPVFVIFGITGDLSRRKLLPALYHLFAQDLLPANTRIIGVSRQTLSVDELLSNVELCVLERDNICDPAGLKRLRDSLQTLRLDPNDDNDYLALSRLLDTLDGGAKRHRLFYMSIPAQAYAPIVAHLGKHDLNDQRTRLLLEKPFGYDHNSAQELITTVDKAFRESQVYRIDHYLAKETAQNLLTFRLHNPIFVPLWNTEYVKRVHITASEKIGIEGRANFYEQTGALRDFVQSHLLQLLAIAMMEVPAELDSQSIHASKLRFLKQLRPADPAHAVRGQYASYRQEVDNPSSTIETYAKLVLRSDDRRWQDTEFILETGKAMDHKATDVAVEFQIPHTRGHNTLVFQIQPNEGISLDLVVKGPGFDKSMHHTALDFRYESAFQDSQHIDTYERVLMDAVNGDQSLFASGDEVMETWRVLQPLLEAWQDSGDNLLEYANGSDGPVAG